MSAQTHRVNAVFSLGIEPPGMDDPDAPVLRLRVRPAAAQADLVSLSAVRQLDWPLTVRMEIPADAQATAPDGGTYHDEGYTDYGWPDGDEFEALVEGLKRPVSGALAVIVDFSAEEIAVQARAQQLSVVGARLELARAEYALIRLDEANGWTYRWPMADNALAAITLSPAANGAELTGAAFWVAVVLQYAPLTPPDGLVALGPICSIQSDKPDHLPRLDLAWSLTPAAAQRTNLQPLTGGDPAALAPMVAMSAAGQEQWLCADDSVTVHGLTTATYSIAGA